MTLGLCACFHGLPRLALLEPVTPSRADLAARVPGVAPLSGTPHPPAAGVASPQPPCHQEGGGSPSESELPRPHPQEGGPRGAGSVPQVLLNPNNPHACLAYHPPPTPAQPPPSALPPIPVYLPNPKPVQSRLEGQGHHDGGQNHGGKTPKILFTALNWGEGIPFRTRDQICGCSSPRGRNSSAGKRGGLARAPPRPWGRQGAQLAGGCRAGDGGAL